MIVAITRAIRKVQGANLFKSKFYGSLEYDFLHLVKLVLPPRTESLRQDLTVFWESISCIRIGCVKVVALLMIPCPSASKQINSDCRSPHTQQTWSSEGSMLCERCKTTTRQSLKPLFCYLPTCREDIYIVTSLASTTPSSQVMQTYSN